MPERGDVDQQIFGFLGCFIGQFLQKEKELNLKPGEVVYVNAEGGGAGRRKDGANNAHVLSGMVASLVC